MSGWNGPTPMKSSKLMFFLQAEWAFRKHHHVISRMRRSVQRRIREERKQRLQELDVEIERMHRRL